MTGSIIFRSNVLCVRIEPKVLSIFTGYRQMRSWQREAGGQIFGHINRRGWVVTDATRPSQEDKRWRFGFRPDRTREQRDIDDFHAVGLDYLGDWHTHPQDVPGPSTRDLTSIDDIARNSKHHLPGFLLCIVGRAAFPTGLWLSFHRGDGLVSRIDALPCDGAAATNRSPDGLS